MSADDVVARPAARPEPLRRVKTILSPTLSTYMRMSFWSGIVEGYGAVPVSSYLSP